jgi:hypothetical protein
MSVGFEDSAGRRREFRLEVHFDRVSRGTIRVNVGPSGKVSWSSDVSVPNRIMKEVLELFFEIRTPSTEEEEKASLLRRKRPGENGDHPEEECTVYSR